ncbi:unnamed protein product [Zymoseptoria tritici ST99CH_1E4]|uniref:chitinase n=1 Tax=Zymoseptoria tritici ST99CH_1E4 TaxID=1276532 RepID=A0A2H1H800_ZYMTR|nr:unnamed protein product [Zymoseptoria tritici ST99CH_1E4]
MSDQSSYTLMRWQKNHDIGAYYPSWRIYRDRKPSDLSVYLADLHCDTRSAVDGTHGALPALVKLKKEQYPHLKVLLSIGGGSGSKNFSNVAADPVKRRTFCETARQLVDDFDLDGIDIDWEHPDSKAKAETFTHLLTQLRDHLTSPRYTITAALPAGEWCLKHIDLPELLSDCNPSLDHVNIMAYDFAGAWSNGQSGHHAQLHAPSNPHNHFAHYNLASGPCLLLLLF